MKRAFLHLSPAVPVLIGALVAGGLLYGAYVYAIEGYLAGTCAPVPRAPFAEGSQGYRIWSGETLKSFEHRGKRICIEDGWEALGALESGPGFATFPAGVTGLLIRSEYFATKTIKPLQSEYEVTLRYPKDTSVEFVSHYVMTVENAFNRVGTLFKDMRVQTPRLHTVLVTAGIAGDTRAPGTRVYPDPGLDVSMLVRTPDYPRGEELLIHAVAHLYNRHRKDLTTYQALQSPVRPEEWQELEATWTETAFVKKLQRGYDWRIYRLNYLYSVHTAVRTDDFSLIHEPPFDNEKEFQNITEGIIVARPENIGLNAQYNHYILAPLIMVATEGLLQERKTGTNIEELLTDLHTGRSTNYFDELKKILTKADVDLILSWMNGEQTIPWDLVLAGGAYYDER